MSPAFTLTPQPHRALGRLHRLELPPLSLRLTGAEALSLSRALAAVRDGRSPEKELFMSPMTSDGYFTARVREDGIAVDDGQGGQVTLDWDAVGALSAALGACAAAQDGASGQA